MIIGREGGWSPKGHIAILWSAYNALFPDLNERQLDIKTDVGLVIVIKLYYDMLSYIYIYLFYEILLP